MEFKHFIERGLAATGTGVSSLYNPWALAIVFGYLMFIPPLVGLMLFGALRLMGASKKDARQNVIGVIRTLYLMPEVTSLPPPAMPEVQSNTPSKKKHKKKS